MSDFLSIGTDLEKDRMLNFATQMDRRSQRICHYNKVREDASAAKEDVPLPSGNSISPSDFAKDSNEAKRATSTSDGMHVAEAAALKYCAAGCADKGFRDDVQTRF